VSQTDELTLSQSARAALAKKDYSAVERLSDAILNLNANSDEGLFLAGKSALHNRNIQKAEICLTKAFQLNPTRHDAAVELANMYSRFRRNGEAFRLIEAATPHMQHSPKYLDLAGTILVEIGMPEKAWPLYLRANELQSNAPILKANLANCGVFVGEFEIAKQNFEELIAINPGHRQNHFHYAKLVKAENTDHIEVMLGQLEDKSVPENRNIPLYFAIGKEYEDLGEYEKAFESYKTGNEIGSKFLNYQPSDDLELIDFIIENCTAEWLAEPMDQSLPSALSSPVFIVGMPRTGTTLVERILSNHSFVSTLGETLFVPNSAAYLASQALGRQTPIYTPDAYKAFMENCHDLPDEYTNHLSYRMGAEPFFIEKLPLNYLFLAPLAKVWLDAKFVVLKRDLMDTGFSIFKQVFTWAYKFSYNLEHIGNYLVAYQRLITHWKSVLGDRLVEIEYEALTQNPEAEIRALLGAMEIPFEPACVDFESNTGASTTASMVQVRSGMSTASVGRWKSYEDQLAPLRDVFEKNGLKV